MRGRGLLAALGLLALALVAPAAPVLGQCAMCKSTVARSPEGLQVAETLNNAILVMVVAPYLVFGTVAAVLFRARLGLFLARVLRSALSSTPHPFPPHVGGGER
ncbi:MAG TPA: hypothetical protein VLI67_01715 [Vicinamibacteria bacterium]|nr:hypothetical protein [Vicinamibacteria bacterium]